MIEQYTADLRTIAESLRRETLDAAVALAELPDAIRGFGPVKDANRARAEAERKELLVRLRSLSADPVQPAMAAE